VTFAEVSRVSKNTAEQRKASQKEKKLRFRQCCCVHLREKREKPSPTLPALAQRIPKYSPEDGLGERHGDKDLRNGTNRSERRGRRGGECVLLFFSSGVESELASEKESAADMRSSHVPVLIRQAAATYSDFLPPL